MPPRPCGANVPRANTTSTSGHGAAVAIGAAAGATRKLAASAKAAPVSPARWRAVMVPDWHRSESGQCDVVAPRLDPLEHDGLVAVADDAVFAVPENRRDRTARSTSAPRRVR